MGHFLTDEAPIFTGLRHLMKKRRGRDHCHLTLYEVIKAKNKLTHSSASI